MTGIPTIVVTMPIRQHHTQHNLSLTHSWWLNGKYPNVTHINKDLTSVFQEFENTLKMRTTILHLRILVLDYE